MMRPRLRGIYFLTSFINPKTSLISHPLTESSSFSLGYFLIIADHPDRCCSACISLQSGMMSSSPFPPPAPFDRICALSAFFPQSTHTTASFAIYLENAQSQCDEKPDVRHVRESKLREFRPKREISDLIPMVQMSEAFLLSLIPIQDRALS